MIFKLLTQSYIIYKQILQLKLKIFHLITKTLIHIFKKAEAFILFSTFMNFLYFFLFY